MSTRSTVLRQALQLPDSDRADIAARLIQSLDRGKPENVEAAWRDEVERRMNDLDSGRVQSVPEDEAWKAILG